MPESAECKLTAEWLNRHLENQVITDWHFISGQYENKDPEGFDEFEDNVPFLVENVGVKGKLIYFVLYNEFHTIYVLHSLRMSGSWQDHPDEFCRWYIELDNGKRIWFRNPRCLATLEFTSDEEYFNNILNRIGPDILTPEFTLDVWKGLLQKYPNRNITSFLMDQTVLSGVGNIIKAESLYEAGISPTRKVGSLKDSEIDALYHAIRIIPRKAYNYGGISVQNFNVNGKAGGYQTRLKIYRKAGAKRLKTSDGRITYYDPNKQR